MSLKLSVQIRKGSVYVDVEFGQTVSSTEPVDIGSLVNVLENEVNTRKSEVKNNVRLDYLM